MGEVAAIRLWAQGLLREQEGTHESAVATVVGIGVNACLAAGGGGCHGAIVGAARLEAVRAEARVVRLARATQVAGLCAHSIRLQRQSNSSSNPCLLNRS